MSTRSSRCIVSLLLVLLCHGAAAALATRPAPNASLAATTNGTCRSRVEPFGYRCEEHTVTTEDGYILSLQRIPSGRAGESELGRSRKVPVLLQHGLMMDGLSWLMNSPNESLGFILADNGYDVWIANSRGTVYSSGHTTLSSADPAYWNWSWDELASNDLSAMLQYVYDQAGQQKVHYVGHSLGTLIALAALSDQQPHVGMLRSAGLLSPIAFLNKVSSPLALAAADVFLAEALYWLGIDEFDPTGDAVHKLVTDICKLPGVDCYDLMSAFTGYITSINVSALFTLFFCPLLVNFCSSVNYTFHVTKCQG